VAHIRTGRLWRSRQPLRSLQSLSPQVLGNESMLCRVCGRMFIQSVAAGRRLGLAALASSANGSDGCGGGVAFGESFRRCAPTGVFSTPFSSVHASTEQMLQICPASPGFSHGFESSSRASRSLKGNQQKELAKDAHFATAWDKSAAKSHRPHDSRLAPKRTDRMTRLNRISPLIRTETDRVPRGRLLERR
jgi:hypothetical protein